MMYRRDMKNKCLDDFGEAKTKAAVKARRPERAVRPPMASAPALAAATALK